MEFEGRSRIHSHLDIAPLIDIVFLLLVFFMLTSTFIKPEAIELQLPESGSSIEISDRSIIVLMDQKGQLVLNGKLIELEKLGKAIKLLLQTDRSATITLKSDSETKVQQLLAVMDAIRSSGSNNIALATKKK